MYCNIIQHMYYVTYEQKEIEKLSCDMQTQQQEIQHMQQQLQLHQENTDTDIGMIVYYYTIYTTLFLKNK